MGKTPSDPYCHHGSKNQSIPSKQRRRPWRQCVDALEQTGACSFPLYRSKNAQEVLLTAFLFFFFFLYPLGGSATRAPPCLRFTSMNPQVLQSAWTRSSPPGRLDRPGSWPATTRPFRLSHRKSAIGSQRAVPRDAEIDLELTSPAWYIK